MPVPTSAPRLAVLLCALEVLGMAGTMTLPTLLPHFIPAWGLTGAEAGWLTGIAQAGYALAVPFLVTLTDRVDPKRVYVASSLLTALSVAGFAWFADGFWEGLLYRALAGVGLAGTYMPGLRILSDHVSGPKASRLLSFYTASYGLGVSASVLLAGWVGVTAGVDAAFWVAAGASGLAFLLAAALLPGTAPAQAAHAGSLLDFRPVLRNRPALGYMLAYAAHNWELFAARGWLVAFLAFVAAGAAPALTQGQLAAFASIVFLLGIPASILGNELAERFGRTRYLTAVMLASACTVAALGLIGPLSLWGLVLLVALHAVTVNADSASLTVGMVANAPAGRKGAAMAVHACLGFTGAFLGPVAFGIVLDLGGGPADPTAWTLAYTSLALAVALGPLALRLAR